MQTAISAASKLVETARREPLGILLHVADDFQPAPRTDQPRQQIRQALARTLQCPAEQSRRQ